MHRPDCEHTANMFSTNLGFQQRAEEAIFWPKDNRAMANTAEWNGIVLKL